MKETFELGEWLPDIDSHENSGLIECANVLPRYGGYKSVNRLSQTYSTGGALSTYCTGLYATPDAANASLDVILACDTIDIYRLTNGTKYNISTSASYYSSGYHNKWSFARFGELVFATRTQTREIQYANIRSVVYSSGTFADIPTPASGAFGASVLGVVGNFLVCGDLWNLTTTYWRNRVRWSAFESPTDFEPSVSTQSDYQDLPDAGVIQAIIGGQGADGNDGLVIAANGIWLMSYVGGELIFDFRKISSIGTTLKASIVNFPNGISFINNDGVFIYRNGECLNISNRRVTNWLNGILDTYESSTTDGHCEKFGVVVDKSKEIILWSIPTINQAINQYVLVWNYIEDRYSNLEITSECLYTANVVGTSSYESKVIAFDGNHHLALFEGSVLTSLFQTGEKEFTPGLKTTLQGIKLLSTSSASYYVYYRDFLTSSQTISSEFLSTDTSTGRVTPRITAKYHSIRVSLGADIGLAKKVEIEYAPRGKRV